MAIIVELDGRVPRITSDAWVAPAAVLIGDVESASGASVWLGAPLRGDFDAIVIGPRNGVQDSAVSHCAAGLPTLVGENVTVGHLAMLEGRHTFDGALIGTGGGVPQRARVGAQAMVGAGAVVTDGAEVPPGTLVAGVPAQIKKELDGSSLQSVETAAREYQGLRERYRDGAHFLQENQL